MPSLSKAKVVNGPKQTARGVKEFVYRGVETGAVPGNSELAGLPANAKPLWGEPLTEAGSEPQKKYTEEELRAREEQALQRGAQEAAAHARENLETTLAAEREKIVVALNEFAREREDYFRNVEGEVVRLVLAVARKVLHREAQVDPLLLTGVVRVALEKIANGTRLKLRVPSVQADAWRAAFESQQDDGTKVEVISDNSLKGPECLVTTEAGTTDLSLEGQLAEIERGFMDLLSQRPGNNSSELHVPSFAA